MTKELTETEGDMIAEAFLQGRIHAHNKEKDLPSIALDKCFQACKRIKNQKNL